MHTNIVELLKFLRRGKRELSWVLMYPVIEINNLTHMDSQNYILIASLIKKHVLGLGRSAPGSLLSEIIAAATYSTVYHSFLSGHLATTW